MKKGLLWAIRHGLSIRDMINNNGCNDFQTHINRNGESSIQATWIDDNKVKDRFAVSEKSE